MRLASQTIPDNKLYKFRALSRDPRKPNRYDKQQLSHLKEIFINQDLYFPSPIQVNDPLDSRPKFTVGTLSDPDYRRRYIDYFMRVIPERGIGPRTPDELRNWLVRHTQEEVQELTDRSTRDYRALILNKYRLCSFSAVADNPLLWSHYADSHRGICMVFSTKNDVFGSAIEVEYSDEYPTLDIIESDEEEVLIKSSVTKFSDWKYEKEYRLITSEPDELGLLKLNRQRFKFDKNHLVGIIFGCKTPIEDIRLMKSWCISASLKVSFYRAELNDSLFKLEIVPLE